MTKKSTSSIIVSLGWRVAVLSGLAAVFAGFGTRWGWWNFLTGFAVLKWAAVGGLCGAAISAVGAVLSFIRSAWGGFLAGLFGLVIALLVVGLPWSWVNTAKQVPPIHDITTDTQNPPQFVALLPLRTNAANPPEYGGPEVAAQQLKAYPDIRPLVTNISPDKAFAKAGEVARRMGWKIIDANQAQGRIEATATTFWFGFKDDIVIRIKPQDNGSRIDVRSESRVGKSDLGANAARIRTFLLLMQG